MRLCLVSPFPPGMRGIGEYALHLVRGLAESGEIEELVVLADRAPGAPPVETVDGARVERTWSRGDWSSSFRLQARIEALEPHLVWYNVGLSMFGSGPLAGFLGLTAPLQSRLLGYPTLVTLHEVVDRIDLQRLGVGAPGLARAGGTLATRLLLQADRVCVTLAHYASLLEDHYRAGNVDHVPHGIFHAPEAEPQQGDGLELLVLAAHGPHKGLPVLLEAYRALQPDFPGLRLTVVGDNHPRFPGYLEAVRARFPGLSGVRWCGYLPEDGLRAAMRSAAVVVAPTLATTGSSSVLHRAAAAGKAIVASDLPDLRAVVAESGLSVQFVPPGDATALAACLRELLQSPGRRRTMGEANLQAARTLTLERTCASYLEIMHQLLAPQAQSVAAS